jgi:hypothetical protein
LSVNSKFLATIVLPRFYKLYLSLIMRYVIPYMLSALIAIAFSFLASERAFSMTGEEQQLDTTRKDSEEASPYVKGITAGRAKSLIGGVLGLTSLIIGWRARARLRTNHNARSLAITALVLGLAAISLSIVHLANVAGGFGTGGGKAGAIVGLVLGLFATVLSWLTLRTKRELGKNADQ